MNLSMCNTSEDGVFVQPDYPASPWIVAVEVVRFVCIPIISCIGLCGNTLSLLVFSARSMKRSSCSVFLAALGAADNVFLISLLISWVDGHIKTLLVSNWACQTLVYMTYVSSFLSAWFIVGFTCERYIAICFPLQSHFLCSVFREKITVYVLTFIALVLYNFSFWTTETSSQGICLHKLQYMQFLNIVTWADTVLTMVLPFFIIVVVNSLVLRAVSKCSMKYKQPIVSPVRMSMSTPEFRSRRVMLPTEVTVRLPSSNRVSHQARVTRTLLFVSFTFLLLNLPSHTLRLYNLIATVTSTVPVVSDKFYFLQEITATLYYSTFSCNFFIYTLFGRNFRHSLCLILRCKSTTLKSRQVVFRRFSYNRNSSRSSCLTSL